MGLSNLQSLTRSEYDRLTLTPFEQPPGATSSGNPDNRVNIQLGGWDGTDTMAFTVTNDPQTTSNVSIDAAQTDTMRVNASNSNDPDPRVSYWTVNMGADNGINSDWQITYDVQRDGRETGKWKFVKGKADDDKPGGFWAWLKRLFGST